MSELSMKQINKLLYEILPTLSNTKSVIKHHERNWEFYIRHPSMICFDEITPFVTRQNPLFFLKKENGSGYVFLHSSLFNKALLINKPFPTSTYIKPEYSVPKDTHPAVEYIKLSSLHIPEWITWAKSVKKAEWPIDPNTDEYVHPIQKIRAIQPFI
jgi:hypothetical protein